GTLTLNKSAGATALAGNLLAGDPVAGTGATVRYLQGNQIADTAAVGLTNLSTLDLNGNSDAVGTLTLQGGTSAATTVSQGGGTLTLAGNLNVGLSGTGATGVVLAGPINLGTQPHEVVVADGAA